MKGGGIAQEEVLRSFDPFGALRGFCNVSRLSVSCRGLSDCLWLTSLCCVMPMLIRFVWPFLTAMLDVFQASFSYYLIAFHPVWDW